MKEIGRFKVVEASGAAHTVIEFQHWIAAGTLEDASARLPGLNEYRLTTGAAVNHVDGDRYEIVRQPMVPVLRV